MAAELGKFPSEVEAQLTPMGLATWAVVLRRREERELNLMAAAIVKALGGK